jgi:hypothetical protein
MDESKLRRKARIGSLKWLGVIMGGAALIGLVTGIISFFSAAQNTGGPQEVAISQIVDGEVGGGKHVQVSGVAMYDVGYEKTEDGKTTKTYYYLVDYDTGYTIIVEHHSPLVVARESGEDVTITGMVYSTPSDLENAIEEDIADIEEEGFKTSSKHYVKDGASPSSFGTAALCTGCSIPVLILAVVPFLFPTKVFIPTPVDTTAPKPETRPSIKASGTFSQITQMEPTVEFGKRTQRFNNAVANLVPLGQGRLLVYIHRIVKTKTYGITVNTQESDWGVPVNAGEVLAIESGKIFGWSEKLAIRVQTPGKSSRPETLDIVFESPGGQAIAVELFQKLGFSITSESPA